MQNPTAALTSYRYLFDREDWFLQILTKTTMSINLNSIHFQQNVNILSKSFEEAQSFDFCGLCNASCR